MNKIPQKEPVHGCGKPVNNGVADATKYACILEQINKMLYRGATHAVNTPCGAIG
jgi:hypothetical protein